MSRRITTNSEMTDVTIACSALAAMGAKFSRNGSNITITSGPLNRATLNTETGQITSDSDYGHNEGLFDKLRQAYGVEACLAAIRANGHSVVSQSTDSDGSVVIQVEAYG